MRKIVSLGAFDRKGNPFQLPASDVHQIESILWQNSVLCYQVDLPSRLRRSIVSNASLDKSSRKWILIDRNILSDIGGLFDGEQAGTGGRKVALAVVLFTRLCNYLPGILSALQEFESVHTQEQAYDDSATVTSAFTVPIESYLKLLNGESYSLIKADIPADYILDPLTPESEFRFPSLWLVSYIVTLKMTTLDRIDSLSNLQKFTVFVEWVYNHFFFSPPLQFTALHFFGIRRDRSILKGARAISTKKLQKSVRNAAWDLHLLMEWHIQTKKQELSILATLDAALRRTALKMRDFISLRSPQELRFILEDWPEKRDATEILSIMVNYMDKLEDVDRPANRGLTLDYYKGLMSSLEGELGL